MNLAKIARVAKQTLKKVVFGSTALVVGFSSLAATAPLFLNQGTAYAANSTLYVSSTGDDRHTCLDSANPCHTLSKAIENSVDGNTIQLNSDLTITSRVNITKQITINGQGHTLSPNFTGPGAGNSNNATLEIAADNVTIKNLTIDGSAGTNLHGINTYKASGAVLSNVTVEDNDRAALVVNGSSVTATNFNTSNNSWGAVNVDPGSGVTAPSVFILNSGTLAESNQQIWSDGSHVGGSATVAVHASGYSKYKKAGTNAFFIWTNQPLANAATITANGTTTLYSSLSSAVADASFGDTINLAAGWYSENITLNKPVTLLGPNANINPNTQTAVSPATITGQISIYSGDVTVKGLTVTNPSWSANQTIKGLHIFSDGPAAIGNITVQNNIFTNINNSSTKGSYGIMVQGVTDGVSILDNKINGISSNGWAHGIEVTPTSASTTVPQNTTIAGNAISNITNPSQSDAYAFSSDSASATNFADASQISLHNNTLLGMVRNLDPSHSLDATLNYWGGGSPALLVSNNVSFNPWFTNAAMTTRSDAKVVPDSSGNAAVNNTTPRVVVSSHTQPLTVTVSNGTNNAVVDYSAIKSGNTAIIPQTTINSSTATVSIPSSTTVNATGGTWDGTITAPTIQNSASVSIPASTGTITTVGTVIEVGAGNISLTFNKAVKLTIPGQAGKLVGFVRDGKFTKITTACSANSQSAGNALPAGGDCYINSGSDLIVWTKHFTKFVTYSTSHKYVVRSGDTMSGIAQKFGLTLAELENLNPQAGHPAGNFNLILPGDVLRLNGSVQLASATLPAPTASTSGSSTGGQVLGEKTGTTGVIGNAFSTADNSQNKAVEGAATTAKATAGLKWYWWLVIAVAVLATIAAARYIYQTVDADKKSS